MDYLLVAAGVVEGWVNFCVESLLKARTKLVHGKWTSQLLVRNLKSTTV